MEKDKGLARMRFRLRAKGRHGTHSPFVYAFIEKVLRHKGHYPDAPPQWSQKEWDLWQATVAYLQPEHIFIDQESFPELLSHRKTLGTKRGLKPLTSLSALPHSQDLLILAHARSLAFIAQLNTLSIAEGRLSIYILHPHSREADVHLNAIIQEPRFKAVMDFWKAALIIQSPDFKEKQFFELH